MSNLEFFTIKFRIDGVGEAKGELYRVKAPHSVENIWYSLPISGRGRIHDNAQAYFLVDLQVKPEHPTMEADVGDIAYCPLQKSIHIFWEKATAVAEVNIIGKITENLDIFSKMRNLTRITIEKVEE